MKLYKNIFIASVFFSLSFVFFSHKAFAARYWVGGNGSTTNATASWASAQGGCGVGGGQSIPTASDAVYFTSSCTNSALVDVAFSALSIDTTGYTGTITNTAGITDVGNFNIAAVTTMAGAGILTFTGNNTGGSYSLSCSATLTTPVRVLLASNGGDFTLGSGCSIVVDTSVTWTSGHWSYPSNPSLINNGTMTVNSGTWTIGPNTYTDPFQNNGTININTSGWTFSGGIGFTNSASKTVTASSLTSMSVGGTFTNLGTFTAGSLTTLTAGGFSPGGTMTLSSLTTVNTSSFSDNHAVLDMTGRTLNIKGAVSGSLSCTGTFSGTFEMAVTTSNTSFTINSGCKVVVDTAAGWTISNGNTFTNNGTILVNSGTWNISLYTNWGTASFINGGTITHNGSGWSMFPSGGPAGNFTNNGTITYSGTSISIGSLNGNGGNFTNNGTLTASSLTSVTANGTFTTGGTMTVPSLTALNTSSYSDNPNVLNMTGRYINIIGYAVGSFSCSGTFKGGFYVNAHAGAMNFTINGGCTINVDTSQAWNVSSGATFANYGTLLVSSGTWTISPYANWSSGTFANYGTITHNGSGWVISSAGGPSMSFANYGTITYAGSSMTINSYRAADGGNFTNGGTFTATSLSTLNVTDAFANNGGATMTLGNTTLYVSTNLSQYGTITATSLTTVLNGSQSGTMYCSGAYPGTVQLSKNSNSYTITLDPSCNSFAGNFTTSGGTSGILATPAGVTTISVAGNVNLGSTGAFGNANLTLALTGSGKSFILNGSNVSAIAGITYGAVNQAFSYYSGTYFASPNFSNSNVAKINIYGSWSSNITISGSSQFFNLYSGTVSGTITISGTSTSVTGAAASVISGNWTFNGTGTAWISLGGTATAGTITINQSADLSGNSTFYNLTVNGGKTLDVSPDGNTTIYNITIMNDIVVTGTILFRTGAVIFNDTNVSKTRSIASIQFYSVVLTSADTNNYTSTFTAGLNFIGNLTVQTTAGTNNYIHTWQIATSSSYAVPGSLTINRFAGGAIPALSTVTASTWNMVGNNSAFINSNGTFTPAYLNFNGSGTTTYSDTNVPTSGTTTINQSSGSVILSSNVTIFNLVISSGNILSAYDGISTSYGLSVKGNFINNAGATGFVSGLGTVTLASKSAGVATTYTITTGGVTFNNLTFSFFNNTNFLVTDNLTDSFTVAGDLIVKDTDASYPATLSATSPVVIALQGNYTESQTATMSFGSNITLNIVSDSKTFTLNSGTFTATLNMSGNGDFLTVTGGIVNADFNFNGTGTTTINTGSGTWSGGTTTLNQSAVLSASSTFFNLTISNRYSLDVSTNNYGLTINGNFVNNAGVTGFVARAGAVTFAAVTGSVTSNNITYNDVIAGGTTVTLLDNLNVGGNFTKSIGTLTSTSSAALNMIGTGKSFTMSNGTFSANLTFGGSGVTTVSAGGTWSGGTTIIQSSGSTVLTTTTNHFYNLTNNGTFNGGTSTSTIVSIAGNLTLSGGIFTATAGTTTLTGNLTLNGGSFVHNNGIFNFNAGTGVNQVITTNQDITFYNLTKYNTKGILTFQVGYTYNVLGAATLSGSGNTTRLQLNPSQIGSITWNFNPTGARNFNYLSPWYSNNIASPIDLRIFASAAYTPSSALDTTDCAQSVPYCDRGYNSSWLFGSSTLMAYWVGNYAGCNGHTGTAACWSATSGGTGGIVIASNFTLFFDGGAATSNAIFDGSIASFAGINISSAYSGTITQARSMSLTSQGFVQNGGKFVGSTDAFSTNNFTQNGGVFNAPSTMTDTGAFTVSASSIFNASSTVNVGGNILDSTTSSSTLDLSTGLAGYWKLDETVSPAADSSVNGNNGTWSGVPSMSPTASVPVPPIQFSDPYALTFNGSSQYINLGNTTGKGIPVGSQVRTYSAWVKFTNNYALNTYGLVLSYGLVSQPALVLFGVGSTAGAPANSVSFDFGGAANNMDGTTSLNDGVWHNIVGTFDGSAMRIYVDGSLQATKNGATANTSDNTTAYIGKYIASPYYYFNGSIDDVRIYNRALSSAEVSGLSAGYNSGTFNGGLLNFASSTVNLTGGTQSITSQGTTTFWNLAKSTSSSNNLSFTAGKVFKILNNLTLSGGSSNYLSLRSSQPGIQWKILPNTSATNSFNLLNIQDSNNIAVQQLVAAGSVDNGNNTNWLFSIPGTTIGWSGTQVATTTIPATNVMLGGAFTAIRTSTGPDLYIKSIKFTQNGSLANSFLTNVRLYYNQTSGSCDSALTFNEGIMIAASSSATYTATGKYSFSTTTGQIPTGIPVSYGVSTCLYLRYDITGTASVDQAGKSIDLSINNPLADVVMDSGNASPSSVIDIQGANRATVIDGNSLGLGSVLSINTTDPTTNPTIFYVQSGAFWMRQGTAAAISLTPSNIAATSFSFVKSAPSANTQVVKITLNITETDPKNPTKPVYAKTFTFTATVKVSH